MIKLSRSVEERLGQNASQGLNLKSTDRLKKAVDEWREVADDDKGGSAEEFAGKFGVDVNDLKKAILLNGIEDGWLIDEYFF